MALPFLLDRLAEIAGDIGDTVATVGDGLALRTGTINDRHFDGAALSAWASNPVGKLTDALPSLLDAGLTALAQPLDGIVPNEVSVTATSNELSVVVGDLTLTWSPAEDRVSLVGTDIDVPGVESARRSRSP